MNIKDFNNYINEKHGVPDDIKEIMKIVELNIKKIKDGNNVFNIQLQDIILTINIHFKSDFKIEYKGEFDILDFINNFNYVINIFVTNTKIIHINMLKIFSIIQHELTHMYEVINYKNPNNSSFLKIPALNKIQKFSKMKEFTNRLYYTLKHEMNARNSMMYSILKQSNTNNITELIDIIKKSDVYDILNYIENFNYNNFIISFNDKNELLNLTNLINKEFKYREIKLSELESYYKKWSKYFINIVKIYRKKLFKLISDVIYENNNIRDFYCYETLNKNIYYNYDIDKLNIREQLMIVFNENIIII